MDSPGESRVAPAALLDNVVWESLAGAQARFSAGTDTARRYAPGLSPIVGFADAERPDFAALAPYCAPGEEFYCSGWAGSPQAGWLIHAERTGHQMVWDAPIPAVDPDFHPVPLGAEHVPQMLELVALRPPGPFAARTRELGEYFGVFDGGRLVAMAGERMEAPPWREISGVCTHPDVAGRGLAWRLIALIVRREIERGQLPFLHVMADNLHAQRVYERIGFRFHQEVLLRIVSHG